jgi:hypothetical protein
MRKIDSALFNADERPVYCTCVGQYSFASSRTDPAPRARQEEVEEVKSAALHGQTRSKRTLDLISKNLDTIKP